jgi:hypothetical protein
MLVWWLKQTIMLSEQRKEHLINKSSMQIRELFCALSSKLIDDLVP